MSEYEVLIESERSPIMRTASITRNTKETQITLSLNLDGTGRFQGATGIGFLDHMLNSFARHGLFDLEIQVTGDLQVDTHHTVEDIGIVLGQAILEAAGDKKGMIRYGTVILPMDDTLMLVSLDLSGRPYLVWQAVLEAERVGELETETVREFFYALSYSAAMNLHINTLEGRNTHHIIEAMFKAFAKALDAATTPDPRIADVLSTKGRL